MDFKQERPSERAAQAKVQQGAEGAPITAIPGTAIPGAPITAPAPVAPSPVTAGATVELAPAAVADRATFEQQCGQSVNPRAFEILPQGNRLVVVVDPTPSKIGLIEIPDSVKDREVMGQGWVLAAGPTTGLDVPYPGGPVCTPDALVGKHIFFGAYAGKVLRLSMFDHEYQGRVLVMTDRDVWCVDDNPDPLAAERQFESDMAAHLDRQARERQRQEDEAAKRLRRDREELAQESLNHA